jgi:integrase
LLQSNGPSQDAGLALLGQKIDQLRTQMNARFDIVDKELNTILQTINTNFNIIIPNLALIIQQLSDLQADLNRFERNFFDLEISGFVSNLDAALTAEQDQLIQQELLRRDDLASNALLLLRHTGMRIGECVNLPCDCLRTLGPGQWAIHVPIGKLKTERWVPVDSTVCQIVDRLRSLRPPDTPSTNRFLLVRPRSRYSVTRMLRTALRDTVKAVGISTRLVPHQFRHSYGTEMASSIHPENGQRLAG